MAKLKTGRHTSAMKANRQSVKQHEKNKSIKSKLTTLVKQVEQAASKKDKDAAEKLLKTTFSAWDKAARLNVIHSNKAANQKNRLSKLVRAL